jgi:hypothetical protein
VPERGFIPALAGLGQVVGVPGGHERDRRPGRDLPAADPVLVLQDLHGVHQVAGAGPALEVDRVQHVRGELPQVGVGGLQRCQRRRALGRLRAPAVRAQGEDGGTRPGHHQAAELESKDDLKRRIDEAAKYVPLDQICLSGQCGFSSTVEGNALTYDEQVAKLRLIVETAHDIWG